MGYHSNYPPSRNQYYRKTKKKQARKSDRQKHIAIKPESGYVSNANQPISNDHRTFRSPCKHINTTHFTIYTCLMMGEASLETSPKNNMIQDMINIITIITHFCEFTDAW